MNNASHKDIQKELDKGDISEAKFWEFVKESLTYKDYELAQSLIDYRFLNYGFCADDLILDILESIPYDNIDHSINLLKKMQISSDRILEVALKIETGDNNELINHKKLIIKNIIEAESRDTEFSLNDNSIVIKYSNNIEFSLLSKVDESILIQSPQPLLELALSKEIIFDKYNIYEKIEENGKRKDFIKKALSNGADINAAFSKSKTYNIEVLNSLSDYLLNNQEHKINADLFLGAVLTSSTLRFDSNNQYTIDSSLVDVKLDLIKKCAAAGAKISNKLSVFIDKGHAFIKLDCADCDKGEAASIYVGMYPPGSADGSDKDKNMFVSSSLISAAVSFIPVAISGYISRGVNILDKFKDENSDKYSILQEFSAGVHKSKLYFDNINSYPDYELSRIPKVTYDITGDAANKLFSRIDHLVNTCDKDLEYQLFGSNCFDFMQDMVARAGLHVNVLEDVTGFKNPMNIFGMYKLIQDAREVAVSTGGATQQIADNIVLQIELARSLYPLAKYLISNASNAINSVYKYAFGNKISEEELNNVKGDLKSIQPKILKNLDKLRKEFNDIQRDNYTKNLEIANASYDESMQRYINIEGEQAIEKVRLMNDFDNTSKEISKDLVKLIKNYNSLSSNSTDIDIKEIAVMDKDVCKKIATLVTYDLSIFAKDDLHRAKLQTLQSMLVNQDASYVSNKTNNKQVAVKKDKGAINSVQ